MACSSSAFAALVASANSLHSLANMFSEQGEFYGETTFPSLHSSRKYARRSSPVALLMPCLHVLEPALWHLRYGVKSTLEAAQYSLVMETLVVMLSTLVGKLKPDVTATRC